MRVVSFNFNNLLSKRNSKSRSWQRRVVNLLSILAQVNADILVCQEIMSVADLKFLANDLHLFYSQRAWHPGGMCILSRYPLQNIHVVSIPNSYYNALVLVRTGSIWVASIHLFSEQYKQCEDTRYKETEWLLASVKRYTQRYKERLTPCILAGDWNSTTKTGQTKCLMKANSCSKASLDSCALPSCKASSLPKSILTKNHWKDAHTDANGSTWIPATKHTIERIDRIYYKRLQLQHSIIIGPEHLSNMKWPTGKDHRMVIADFRVV